MIYKGLDLDPKDMIIVIAEMSSILKHEVTDLEGSSPKLDSRSSSKLVRLFLGMRSLRRIPTRLFDEAEEFNKLVAQREREEHEEKRVRILVSVENKREECENTKQESLL